MEVIHSDFLYLNVSEAPSVNCLSTFTFGIGALLLSPKFESTINRIFQYRIYINTYIVK